ncbi:MAG: glutathione S-transferase family protein [Rhizobiales bacterium]|nr:glutathione S-transferase family protein [Hyphomicrobiales bacterium]
MSDLILHHYPPSPVTEKIRTGFGLKDLHWRSCEQNRLPDRPELFAMTGGYRRIPVLQIGADIYCDTQCMFHALEAVKPEPSFFPGGSDGMPFAVSRWTDRELFDSAFRVAFAPVFENLPPAFVADRARLYLGPDGDLAKELADLPHTLAQLRAQIGWLETRLATGRSFLLGAEPGMPDLLAWFIVWFVRARYGEAESFFAEFPALNAWADRMGAIGHGTSQPISPTEALAVAKAARPTTAEQSDPRDPQGLKPGMQASVAPTTDSGETAVEGVIRAVSRDTIALTRTSAECGEVAVHFPRVGYRVSVLD